MRSIGALTQNRLGVKFQVCQVGLFLVGFFEALKFQTRMEGVGGAYCIITLVGKRWLFGEV